MGVSPRACAGLRMPEFATNALPSTLSQTGAFFDTAALRPASTLIPYDINVPFWSDGADKRRWMAAPEKENPLPSVRRVGVSARNDIC